MIVFLDGAWVPVGEARIPISDHGLLYGDGVFETARLHRGRFFRLAAHLDRLRGSAALLRLPIAERDELQAIADGLVARNTLDEGVLRITVTRGTPPAPGTTLFTLQPIPSGWQARAARGWRVIVARTRRPSTAAVPAELKALGRTYALLARAEAVAAGADDAIMLSDAGHLAEGPTWNVFWRRGEQLFTPHHDVGIMGGMTRAAVIDLAGAHGVPVVQGAWPASALADADEIFATMTSLGIVSITGLDGCALTGEPLMARRLHRAYWDLVRAETGRE